MNQTMIFRLLCFAACVAVGCAIKKNYLTILCAREECNCDAPKDPYGVSGAVNFTYSYYYDCICLCGKQHYEVCGTDADCVEGFACSGDHHGVKDQETKVCTCPCDETDFPYCPSPFSQCNMNDADAACECEKQYNCKHEYMIPICVVWENDTVFEYRNPCSFAVETCSFTKYDLRWKIFPKSCKEVDKLLDSEVESFNYPNKIRHILGESALELIQWDPKADVMHPRRHGMSVYPEPEPEAEPLAEFRL